MQYRRSSDLLKYACSIASRAVNRSWWLYRRSLSRKSIASGLTRCWFSLWINRSQRLRECLHMYTTLNWLGQPLQHATPYTSHGTVPLNLGSTGCGFTSWSWQNCVISMDGKVVHTWTCNQQVVRSIPTRTKLRNNLGQLFAPVCLCHQAV